MEHIYPRHVYYLKSRKINLVLAVLTFITAAFVLVSGQSISGVALLIIGISMYGLTTFHIIVSPSGISYHDTGLTLRTTWNNIDRVELVDFRVFGSRKCIILKKEIKVNSWKGISWAAPSDKRGKIIPMLDDKRLEKFDELKIQIKSYAPDITGLS